MLLVVVSARNAAPGDFYLALDVYRSIAIRDVDSQSSRGPHCFVRDAQSVLRQPDLRQAEVSDVLIFREDFRRGASPALTTGWCL